MKRNHAILIAITIINFITCNNIALVNKDSAFEFRQRFSINSFDSAVVDYGSAGDSTNFITLFDFSPIEKAINSAVSTENNMIWKGSFHVKFKNNIVLKISYYGCFFLECSTGTVFIVSENYASEFKKFNKNMMMQISQMQK